MHAAGKRLERAIADYQARVSELRDAKANLKDAELEVAAAKWGVIDHEVTAAREARSALSQPA